MNLKSLESGHWRVIQTMGGASKWNPISGDLMAGNAAVTTSCPGNGSITTMDVSHQNSSIVLAGTSNGAVWETTTGGAIWDHIHGGLLPPRHVTAVRAKRTHSTRMIAYLSFSRFRRSAACGNTS